MAETTSPPAIPAEPDELPVGSADLPSAGETVTPAAEESGSSLRAIWLSRADQHAVAIVCCLLLSWAVFRWADLSRWGREPIEIARLAKQEYAYVVDPNEATWIELSLLEGLGETLSKRIVENREEHGPFRRAEDLLRVRGIGKKTLARFADRLRFAVPADEVSSESSNSG
ncbi:MAG: hypothetical protein CMJ47_01540 [Planctomyces sp.]|nr:hypothetical protein [Planctomyces sp.]